MSAHLRYHYYRLYRVVSLTSPISPVVVLYLMLSWGVPGWFVLLGVAVMAWIEYLLLVRTSYEIEVYQGILTWKAILRSGSVPVADVTAVRPYRLAYGIGVFELSSGRPILVRVRKGFRDLCVALAAQQPGLRLDRNLGWLTERLPWPGSGFSSD
jgi:hypothetical protein